MVALLILLAPGLAALTVQPDSAGMALRLRAHADGRLDPAVLRGAQRVAEGLLASAGLLTTWRLCDGSEPCPPQGDQAPDVVVILSSEDRSTPRCGVAALGARFSGTVVVSVPCVVNVARRLARQSATRSHPALATARYDDIVGAAVAHEIGHVLGLPHASSGLMRARLDSEDILALRLGRLAFTPMESAAMRRRQERPQSAAASRAIR